VWEVLSDWDRQAGWMPDVAWMRLRGSERALGARLDVRTKVLGIPATTDVMEVTGWEPPRRMVVEHRGMVKGRGEWLLEPLAGGTRFTWVEDLTMPFGIAGEAALRAYAPVQRANMERSIRNLATLLRSGGPAGS
jgi:hypothetical protein